ncbi:hypothetical protein GBAR_LOCUS13044, partial [Geodia barretti]
MESVETACTMPPLRPQPRIAAFVGENTKNVFFFFQDYILGHPDSRKKSVEVILELYQTLNATFKCFVCLSCDSFFHHYSSVNVILLIRALT